MLYTVSGKKEPVVF